ncbi:DUF4865 family protein [Saccharothrix sp. BKS2]|uniref:DUF4865 family protein n=1 Tax=Saccharothrix sp. BKS2 TaxID=3064400 RepID=UPI0039E79A34
MHYEITLPADYDMGVIRTRVATRGSATDEFPGLGLKAYCVRERGVDGSPVNQYSPFYLWRTAEGMNSFLWGPGFRGLSADFGRPAVRHWVGLAFARGPAATPTDATKRTRALPADADAAEAVQAAVEDLGRVEGHPALHSTAVAVDPARWELVRFSLWSGPPPEEDGAIRYRVPHLSSPELDDLSAGRHW